MTSEPRQEQFGSSSELLKRLQERADDLDQLSIMVVNDLPMVGPKGQGLLAKNSCGVLKTCSGESIVINRNDLEILLNDGILQRMKIPISLVPREAR
ncbi:MAG: hypothetical protein C0478_16080 [Planctomyces sp.]|nr:hypothetical protein [Planctomyces sp.]